MKYSFPLLVAGTLVIALTFGTKSAYSAFPGGGPTPNMMCDPETNPDCAGGEGGGGGSGGPCPISCSTGTVTSVTTLCETTACGYDPIYDRYLYSGTRITHREASGPNCQTSNLTCWDGLACGNCFP